MLRKTVSVIMPALFLASVLTLAFDIQPAKSLPTVSFGGYTDKPKYVSGEAGTVYFWIYNWGPDPIILKNITIYYPWGDNRTIADINIVLAENGNYSNSNSFIIFDDERAVGGYIEFHTVYSIGASNYQRIDTVPLHVVRQLVAVYGATPSIDGFMSLGEWDDASTVSFNTTVVYVKQDGQNLYVAFNVSDSTVSLSYDGAAVAMDVLNDGGASPQDDDVIFYVIRNGTLLEAQNAIPPSSPTGGWNGSASSTSDYWQAEFNITYARLQINPGEPKILGFVLMSYDYAIGYPGFWPPMSPSEAGPSNWGNLISEENWIPELSPFIVLPLFIIATLLVLIVCTERAIKNRKLG